MAFEYKVFKMHSYGEELYSCTVKNQLNKQIAFKNRLIAIYTEVHIPKDNGFWMNPFLSSTRC